MFFSKKIWIREIQRKRGREKVMKNREPRNCESVTLRDFGCSERLKQWES